MPTEMGGETVEIITMAMDKYQGNKNYEVRIRMKNSDADVLFVTTMQYDESCTFPTKMNVMVT